MRPRRCESAMHAWYHRIQALWLLLVRMPVLEEHIYASTGYTGTCSCLFHFLQLCWNTVDQLCFLSVQRYMPYPHQAPSVTCERLRSMSLDVSGAELSGSFCSSGTADISCPGDATPRLIPTPSIPSLTAAEDYPGGARSGMSSLFTTQEISQIMKAEQLVGQLRHRFDCQPERSVRFHEGLIDIVSKDFKSEMFNHSCCKPVLWTHMSLRTSVARYEKGLVHAVTPLTTQLI